MGRQLFSPSDVDLHKSVVLIGRINRFFGTDWEGVAELYNESTTVAPANITISCVDTGSARKGIKNILAAAVKEERGKQATPFSRRRVDGMDPFERPYYWMDFGNMMDRGQVVISTLKSIEQPLKSDYECIKQLPSIDHYHPEIFKDQKGDDQGPSCSLAEALHKQDLFINTNLANMGLGILWKMFRELHIKFHGCYVNLNSMSVNPIKV